MNAVIPDPDAPFGHSHGPMLTHNFAPVPDEVVLTDLLVEGEIPEDLNGVYLRTDPIPGSSPRVPIIISMVTA